MNLDSEDGVHVGGVHVGGESVVCGGDVGGESEACGGDVDGACVAEVRADAMAPEKAVEVARAGVG